MVSEYPQRLFQYINQQIDILASKLTAEQFIQILQSLSENLKDTMRAEGERIQKVICMTDQNNFDTLLLIMHINNFWKLVICSNETKTESVSKVLEVYQDRVEHIFIIEMQKNFKVTIEELMLSYMILEFKEIRKKILPELFTKKWVPGNALMK